MLKMTGLILIFFACLGAGCTKGQRLSQRIRQLRQLIRLVEFLKGEISFARTTLPDAFLQISGKLERPMDTFCRQIAEEMRTKKGEEFSHLLLKTIEKTWKNTCLEPEDVEEFYQTASHLGYLDQRMQIHLLEGYLRELQQKTETLMKELPGQRKLFQSLGLLGGVFFVILLV